MFPAMDNFDKIKNFNAVFLPSKNNPKISEKKLIKKSAPFLEKCVSLRTFYTRTIIYIYKI